MHDKEVVISLAKLYTQEVYSFDAKVGGHNEIDIVKGRRNFVLRITPIAHRNYDDIKSEVDFMIYLKENGVRIAAPLSGLDSEYVYQVQFNDAQWVLAAFELAVGEDFMMRVETPERFVQIGKTLGQIHRLSKSYKPRSLKPRRQWYQNQHIVKAPEIFYNYDKELCRIFDKYMTMMMDLPKNEEVFGLIHGDYLLSNYFFSGNEITVFDFDDCEYSWYLTDLAVCILFYLIGAEPAGLMSRKKEAEKWFAYLIKGYLAETTISSEQIRNIDLFFKMREYNLLSYNLAIRDKHFSKWQNDLVSGILDRVMNGKPFINIDFSTVFDSCTL